MALHDICRSARHAADNSRIRIARRWELNSAVRQELAAMPQAARRSTSIPVRGSPVKLVACFSDECPAGLAQFELGILLPVKPLVAPTESILWSISPRVPNWKSQVGGCLGLHSAFGSARKSEASADL